MTERSEAGLLEKCSQRQNMNREGVPEETPISKNVGLSGWLMRYCEFARIIENERPALLHGSSFLLKQK